MGSVGIHAREHGLTRLTKRKGRVAVYETLTINAVPFFEFAGASRTETIRAGLQTLSDPHTQMNEFHRDFSVFVTGIACLEFETSDNVPQVPLFWRGKSCAKTYAN
jgi:hypothetical protein